MLGVLVCDFTRKAEHMTSTKLGDKDCLVFWSVISQGRQNT